MDKSQVLAQLKDIHLPPSIGLWPLAIGWWVVIAVLLVACLVWFAWGLRAYWRSRAKRRALKMLQKFKVIYDEQGDTVVIAGHVSALLRRVALAYFPREDVAGLKGINWIHFLDAHGKRCDFLAIKGLLLVVPYQQQSKESLEPLFSMSESWIKERGKPCLN